MFVRFVYKNEETETIRNANSFMYITETKEFVVWENGKEAIRVKEEYVKYVSIA